MTLQLLLLVGLVIASLGIVRMSRAQSSLSPPSIHFERVEGLSHRTVLALLQDHRGFLWIGTSDGLNRYDGYGFTAFRHDPRDSTSLSNNTVQALAETEDGTLWIGTAHGLNRLDRATQRFVHHPIFRDDRPHHPDIAQLAPGTDGALWILTYAEELYRYEPATRTVTRYPKRMSALGTGYVGLLCRDTTGTLWTTTHTNSTTTLHRYDATRDRFVRSSSPSLPPHATLFAARSGTWWMSPRRLGRLAPETSPSQPSLSLPDAAPIRRLVEGQTGTLWIGTEQGVLRVQPSKGAVTRHLIDTTGTAPLRNYVWTLLQDRTGILWVGTRSGLYRHDPNRKPFSHWPSVRMPGRPAPPVTALHEDASGRRWIGTLGEGLLQMNGLDDPVASLRHSPDVASSPPSNRVWTVHPAKGTHLWVGTEAGLCLFDPNRGQCERHLRPADAPFVHVLTSRPDSGYWVGGADLYRLTRTGSLSPPLGVHEHVGSTTVQALHSASACSDTLWIGTEGAGLLRYVSNRGTFKQYPIGVQGPSGLPGTTVWTIRPGIGGHLWLGTDLGLVRFDPHTETFTAFYDPAQLPGAHVYSVLANGPYLWLGTSRGLVRFDSRTAHFHAFDTGGRSEPFEFNRRAALRASNGAFIFGHLEGLLTFHPDSIRSNPHASPVVITEVLVNGPNGSQMIRPYDRDYLTLGHRENAFAVRFTALSFTQPHRNQYAYRLDGFDADWIDGGTARQVRYTNVPPGTYTFRVRAANNDGRWNEAGASLRLTITPPFWQTWWFRLLALGVFVGLLAAAYRYRVNHLLELERLRLRIASDLHDDVGSKLGSVALMSDLLQRRVPDGAPERAELQRISHIVRQTAETLRDIVWFVDPGHDRPEALLWKLKNAAAALLNGLDYTFDYPPNSELSVLGTLDVKTRRNLFLIYKEALHNIARHAQASSVRIVLRRRGSTLMLTIEDNGIGFDPADSANRGHGLTSMHRRAEQIGADLSLNSRSGRGTTLRLVLVIP